jgi:ubiquinone/menaquinone biosynthesis C-methylase UbiE
MRPTRAWPALLLLCLLPARAGAEHLQTQPQSQTAPAHGHDHDAKVSHPFDDVDRWMAVFDDPSRAGWQKPDKVPALLGLKPGMTVADIGAGTGYFERYFSQAVGSDGKVYAQDIEPNMVAHIRERALGEKTPNVIPLLGAPDDPKLPDASVDVVFICDTWHHINDRLEYLGRLGKALKPGGIVAVVDFHKRDLPVGPSVEHKMSREEVVAEFEEAAWTLARESDLLPYQYVLIFAPPR